MKQASVILSQKLEDLALQLHQSLFTPPVSPFDKRIILLPSQHMEKWLRHFFCEISGEKIAMGYQPMSLEEGVRLFKEISESKAWHTLPDSLGLLYALASCMRSLLKEDRNNPLLSPLISYIGYSEKEIFALSSELATLFKRYLLYGARVYPEWEKNPQNWQQLLWARIMNSYPQKKIQTNSTVSDKISVSLFAFSHLSPEHFALFQKLGEQLPVSFYTLSPCREFWTDINSDWEAKRISSKQTSPEAKLYWEELLEERHPLLANWGKVGREWFKAIEESNLPTEEFYTVPTPSSQLKELQRQFLELDPVWREKISSEDESIQLHVCSSRFREVQNLLNQCIAWTQKGLSPRDIVVMAPDISLYVPHIQALFQDYFDYQIGDLPAWRWDPVAQGFFCLLGLEEKRWSAEALLEVLSHPLIAKKQGWEEEEIALLKKWIKQTSIRWGIDLHHQNRILARHQLSFALHQSSGSWKDGIELLIKRWATSDPTLQMSQKETILLGEFASWLISLYDDLNPLVDSAKGELTQWVEYFKSFAKTYLAINEEEGRNLFSLFERLKIGEVSLAREQYPAAFVKATLLQLFSDHSYTLGMHKAQAIRFCSLLPMRAIPAPVVVLLGMNEGDFPRQDVDRGLDLLKNSQIKEKFPSRTEFDRYLFLEAILSARTCLMISYTAQSSSHNQPASTVSDLLSFLPVKKEIVHPAHSYDPKYFSNSTPLLKNYSMRDYRAACAKENFPSLITSEKVVSQDSSLQQEFSSPRILDIKHLLRWVRDPLQIYFKKGIGITMEQSVREDEEFTLSYRTLAHSRRFWVDGKGFISHASHPSDFLNPLFSELASLKLSQEKNAFQKTLEKWEVYAEHVNSLTLHPHETQMIYEGKQWKGPPLRFRLGDQEIILVGEIEGIVPKGLLVHEKGDISGAARAFIPFLLLQEIAAKEKLPFKLDQLIFLRDGEHKQSFFAESSLLCTQFLQAYLESHHLPFYLLPEWLEAILSKEEKKLSRQIDQVLLTASDRGKGGIEWLKRRGSLPKAEEIIEECHAKAIQLYGEMKNAWF